MRRTLFLSSLLPLLAACHSSAPEIGPELNLPEAWREAGATAESAADRPWTELFQDPALQALIREALENNRDLKLAAARVLEARAQAAAAGAALWPELDASGGYTRQEIATAGFPALPPGIPTHGEEWSAGLQLSYELDLWGKLSGAEEAAARELLATEEARNTVLLALVGDVAAGWYDLQGLDLELSVTQRTLATREESLRIIRRRAEEKIVSELDLSRAEGEVASAAARIPDLERRIAETEHRLSLLAGRNPGPVARGAGLPEPAAEVPPGLPADLLQRRPDVRQAQQEFQAACARIGVAEAAFLPGIALTGQYGYESMELSDLLTDPARLLGIGLSLQLPLFDGGRREAELDAARARAQEAAAQYESTVLQSLREVEDALVARRKQAEVRRQQEALVGALQRAERLARASFDQGVGGYLELLDAQRELLSAEDDLARTRSAELVSLARLYQALGGGWARS